MKLVVSIALILAVSFATIEENAAAPSAEEMEKIIHALASSVDLTKDLVAEDFQKLGVQAQELISKQPWSDQEKEDAMNMLKAHAAAAMEKMEADKAAKLSGVEVDEAKLAASIINTKEEEKEILAKATANGPADLQMSKRVTATKEDLQLWAYAVSVARKLKAEAKAGHELTRDIDALLDLEVSSKARQGWWWESETPALPACTTMLNGHSLAEVKLAAHLAKMVYTKGGFDTITHFSDGTATNLVVAYYLENGAYDLDFGEADNSGSKVGYIVFAGSESTQDWLQNFQIWPNYAKHGVPGWVEHGFQQQYEVGRPAVASYVQGRLSQGVKKFFVIGHSLGGAVASIAATDMQTNFPGAEIHLITFAAPMNGCSTWAAHANAKLGSRMTRFQVSNDPVPCIPPGYSTDMKGLVFWNDEDQYWNNVRDWSCSNLLLWWEIEISHHSMDFYINTITSKCT